MKKKLTVKVYTDGACSQNPGAGGWAALLLIKSKKSKESITIKGGEKNTTNNRMELSAVMEAIKFVNKNFKEFDVNLEILSDSTYVVNSINSGSIYKWESNGWKTSRDTDVANQGIWMNLMIELKAAGEVTFTKVKGHSNNKFNDFVDQMAVAECAKYKKLLNNI